MSAIGVLLSGLAEAPLSGAASAPGGSEPVVTSAAFDASSETLPGGGFGPVPLSLNATGPANITLRTTPDGLFIDVDGVRLVAPQTFQWENGSTHVVAVLVNQTSAQPGVRYSFVAWSDGGGAERVVTAEGDRELTAAFDEQFLVNITTSILPAAGLLVDYVQVAPPAEFWWNNGSMHELEIVPMARPGPGWRQNWLTWSDNGEMKHSTIITGSTSFVANIQNEYQLALDTSFGDAECDHQLVGCWYTEGQVARFALNDAQTEVAGTRQDFRGWVDNATAAQVSGSILMDRPRNLTAIWVTQFHIVVDAGYGEATCDAIGCWYDAESQATVTLRGIEVQAQGGLHRFSGWQGDVASNSPQITITMDRPKTIAATWAPASGVLIQTPLDVSFVVVLVGLAIAGAAYASTPRGEWALASLSVPLFTRLGRDDVRNQFTRGRLLGFIEGNPGASYTEIKRTLGLSNGACAYHLRVLERNGDVRRVVRGASVRFYGTDYRLDAEALPPLPYLQRQVLSEVVASGTTTFAEISAALAGRGLQVTDTNLGYHLSVLAREKRLIMTRREGRKTVYFVEAEQREYLRRRLKEGEGVDEAMDAAAVAGGELAIGDLDAPSLRTKGDAVVRVDDPEPAANGEVRVNRRNL